MEIEKIEDFEDEPKGNKNISKKINKKRKIKQFLKGVSIGIYASSKSIVVTLWVTVAFAILSNYTSFSKIFIALTMISVSVGQYVYSLFKGWEVIK